MTQDEFKNLTTEEMLSIARQDYKTTSPDFQQATGLDFSYTTMVNLIKERGYVRSGKQWLPLPKETDREVAAPNSNGIEMKYRTVQDPIKVSYMISKADRDKMNEIAKNSGLSTTALINLLIRRFLQDVDNKKINLSVSIKF